MLDIFSCLWILALALQVCGIEVFVENYIQNLLLEGFRWNDGTQKVSLEFVLNSLFVKLTQVKDHFGRGNLS